MACPCPELICGKWESCGRRACMNARVENLLTSSHCSLPEGGRKSRFLRVCNVGGGDDLIVKVRR